MSNYSIINNSHSYRNNTPKSNRKSNYSKNDDKLSNDGSFSYSKIFPNSQLIDKNKNNINGILLTSIFSLPKINNSNKEYNNYSSRRNLSPKKNIINLKKQNIFSSIDTKKIRKIINENSISNNNSPINTETYKTERKNNENKNLNLNNNINKDNDNKKYSKLESFLKKKFYCDFDENIKQHNKIFTKDKSLNNKIIHMKKINNFWIGLCNYMNPIFSIERFKLKKILNNSKKKINEKKGDYSLPRMKTNLPKVYTNNMLSNYRYNKKIKEEKEFYKKLIDSQKEYEFYN